MRVWTAMLESKIPMADPMVETEGIARGPRARRRSREAWAPPYKIFMLKNFAPAFDSPLLISTQKNRLKPVLLCAVETEGIEPSSKGSTHGPSTGVSS